MIKSITPAAVDEDLFQERWGIKACEYTMSVDGKKDRVDFQDLMVHVAEQRATSVEGEVTPLSRRIKTRNEQLKNLGKALSQVTGAIGKFDTSKTNDNETQSITWSAESQKALALVGWTVVTSGSYHKSQLDELNQLLKSKIDTLNNEAQTDMTRLQSLVDHRDQAYTTATTLMTSISDTRGNLIKNL